MDRSYRRRPREPCSSLPALRKSRICVALRTLAPMNRTPARTEKLAFVAGPSPEAQSARARLSARYGEAAPESADVIVPLGGDGFMLQTLHRLMSSGKPIYGMHRGTVGFLMNEYQEDGLRERIAAAEPTVIHPLRMRARDMHGIEHESHAITEVSVFRESYQAAQLRTP